MKLSLNDTVSTLSFEGEDYYYIDLLNAIGGRLREFPYIMRYLLENILRCMEYTEKEAKIDDMLKWLDASTSKSEIPFQPGRVLMHDTTSTPALVDIAAMRNTLHENGVDPKVLSAVLQVDISIDHSLSVEAYGQPDAAKINMQHEMRRNSERYKFLKWASSAMKGLNINPPGTGIMHTINLEQLSTVVKTEKIDGEKWVVPDTLIGTDSHTTMINGIGVLGWGVGGLEAETVMFGMPVMIRIPEVIGVYLTGKLKDGVQSTDLAITITKELRAMDVTGCFVEYFGPGVSTLSTEERAVVANMAPEYGATTGFFPVDENVLLYMKSTGKPEEFVKLIEQYSKKTGLWFDENEVPKYTRTLSISLGDISIRVAGPKRPQDMMNIDQISDELKKIEFIPAQESNIPRLPVAFAAITSCTNTSDPRLLIAAGLVAQKAVKLGLKVPEWVKTSFTPGSPASKKYMERSGLMGEMSTAGFDLAGYGCATCIGNSGPLGSEIKKAYEEGLIKPVAMVSGNRNFPGRIHPDVEYSFIMSPALVVAYAFAGDAERDLSKDPVQINVKGKKVYLKDIWPSKDEIQEIYKYSIKPDEFKTEFVKASNNKIWSELKFPVGELFPWNPRSTKLRRPPFTSVSEGSLLGEYEAYPLIIVGDDITTDNISPASAIPSDSFIADFLVEKGEQRDDLNVFASRRGNWEVMTRGAFYSKTLQNLLCPGSPVGHTLHVPSDVVMSIFDVAGKYKKDGDSVVVIAGERYGMGSSRDWAAKVQRLLGVRCVIATSFERIHRSNLICMGILPLCMLAGMTPEGMDIQAGDMFVVKANPEDIYMGCSIEVIIKRKSGEEDILFTKAAIETKLEVELLRKGGVIPSILNKYL